MNVLRVPIFGSSFGVETARANRQGDRVSVYIHLITSHTTVDQELREEMKDDCFILGADYNGLGAWLLSESIDCRYDSAVFGRKCYHLLWPSRLWLWDIMARRCIVHAGSEILVETKSLQAHIAFIQQSKGCFCGWAIRYWFRYGWVSYDATQCF